MIKIYFYTFGLYLISAFSILAIIKLLVRRWWIISLERFLFSTLIAAVLSTAVFYIFMEYFEYGNIGGGSGMGAVVLAVGGLIAGGIIGFFTLLIISGLLFKAAS